MFLTAPVRLRILSVNLITCPAHGFHFDRFQSSSSHEGDLTTPPRTLGHEDLQRAGAKLGTPRGVTSEVLVVFLLVKFDHSPNLVCGMNGGEF